MKIFIFIVSLLALKANAQSLNIWVTDQWTSCPNLCASYCYIDATVNGGTPPYSYNWVPVNGGVIVSGQGTDEIGVDCTLGGDWTFTCTVTDAANNTATATGSFIDDYFMYCANVINEVTYHACDGACSGVIRVYSSNAYNPYISGIGSPDSTSGASQFFTGLCPGSYIIEWDGDPNQPWGCGYENFDSPVVLINMNTPDPISVHSVSSAQSGMSNGTVTIDMSTTSGKLRDDMGSLVSNLSSGTIMINLPAGDYSVERTVNSTTPSACAGYDTVLFTIPVAAPQLLLEAKAMLSGALDDGTMLMDDGMRANGHLPLAEPYSALGYTQAGNGATSINDATVLNTTGNDAIVDWVVLELRSPTDPAAIEHSRYCLIQRDGDVVDVDGVSPVGFEAPAGQFFVAMRHRNHLGAMAANTVSLSTISTQLDLTSTGTAIWGTDAMQDVNGTMCLWSGDVNFDGALKYTGADNDRDAVLIAIGGNNPTAVLSNSYSPEDLNMDGEVKYTGSSNDRDLILVNIGGSDPTAVRIEQLP